MKINIINLSSKKITPYLDKLHKYIKKHLGDTIDLNNLNGYLLLVNNILKGYALYKEIDSNTVKVEWIYAEDNLGTILLKQIEKKFSKNYDKIILNVSIDPLEQKNTVMRRLNFYIKNDYRVYDIIFRKKYGPLFLMIKIFNKKN